MRGNRQHESTRRICPRKHAERPPASAVTRSSGGRPAGCSPVLEGLRELTAGALDRLAATIAARQGADPGESWTARLLSAGPEACARKFGEESLEAVIEAVRGDRDGLTAEAADVLYHLLVMLAARGVTLRDVEAELARREGTSGVAEKAARKPRSLDPGSGV